MNDDTSFTIPLVNCSFVSNYRSSIDVVAGLDSIGAILLKVAPNVLIHD